MPGPVRNPPSSARYTTNSYSQPRTGSSQPSVRTTQATAPTTAPTAPAPQAPTAPPAQASTTPTALQRPYQTAVTPAALQSIANSPQGGHNQVVQTVEQGSHPVLKHAPGGGACKGITSMWMAAHRTQLGAQASQTFGQTLNSPQGSQGMLTAEQRIDQLAAQPPTQASFASMQKVAGGNMNYQGSTPHQFGPGQELAAATDVVNRMQTPDGFYRLAMNDGAGNGHVMGVMASATRNQYGMMDPNTGEFRASSKQELPGLIARNMQAMNYGNHFNRIDLHHYSAT